MYNKTFLQIIYLFARKVFKDTINSLCVKFSKLYASQTTFVLYF